GIVPPDHHRPAADLQHHGHAAVTSRYSDWNEQGPLRKERALLMRLPEDLRAATHSVGARARAAGQLRDEAFPVPIHQLLTGLHQQQLAVSVVHPPLLIGAEERILIGCQSQSGPFTVVHKYLLKPPPNHSARFQPVTSAVTLPASAPMGGSPESTTTMG